MPKNESSNTMTPKSIHTNPWVAVEPPPPTPTEPKKTSDKMAKGNKATPKK
jgi:hypothetical protein